MNDLILKYSRLSDFAQKQLIDFLDFLLGKQEKQKPAFDLEEYRKNLQKVSVWEEENIREVEDAGKNINWKIEEW